MKLVFICSPFRGDVARNIRYAKAALADCIKRHEAPIATHLLYAQPGVLDDDDDEAQRAQGMRAGEEWMRVCDVVAVYNDFGLSSGMEHDIARAGVFRRPIEFRSLPDFGRESPWEGLARPMYAADGHCGKCGVKFVDGKLMAVASSPSGLLCGICA